ncbi:hypothetical protein NDU88_004597 [Pleurodeles waltl]|uniref:Uncharacterized protein n=1 Tax=Pleurodeles waltl TaxID=8319 RepID=A0AAV7MVL4_PLEWA|nr:hypothetical protein NDU88_004597 [Pleurodeles waltl]
MSAGVLALPTLSTAPQKDKVGRTRQDTVVGAVVFRCWRSAHRLSSSVAAHSAASSMIAALRMRQIDLICIFSPSRNLIASMAFCTKGMCKNDTRYMMIAIYKWLPFSLCGSSN